jgi:hypothetical protein
MKSVIFAAVVTVQAITLRRTCLRTLRKEMRSRVDSRACGQLHDDPGQAVAGDQVRPCLLAGQFRAGGAQDLLRPALERLDLTI